MLRMREPALWSALAGVAIKLIAAFWLNLSTNQQSLLNAIVLAGVGLIVARSTKDGQGAAILGFGQALLALAIGFGLGMSADNQATIMSGLGIIVAMFIRTQATAPTAPHA